MLLNLPELIQKYEMNITGVIHIGAHHGQEIDVYNQLNIPNIVMFEPCKSNYDKLIAKVNGQPNIVCINKGLGPFSCKMEMYKETSNNGQSNSVLEPHLHVQQYPGIIFNDKEWVNIDPLDKYEPSPTLNFINIDVQGFELEVFRGAKNTLKNIKYIMTEVNRAELYKGCCTVEELDEFLGTYGFKRTVTDWAGNTWGDALYSFIW